MTPRPESVPTLLSYSDCEVTYRRLEGKRRETRFVNLCLGSTYVFAAALNYPIWHEMSCIDTKDLPFITYSTRPGRGFHLARPPKVVTHPGSSRVEFLPRIHHDVNSRALCYWCDSVLIPNDGFDTPLMTGTEDYDPEHYLDFSETLHCCPQCGWWALESESHCNIEYVGDGGGYFQNSYRLISAVSRRYDLSRSDIPIQELRRWLKKHPDHVAHVDPFLFEKLMADCFSDFYKDARVFHIGGRRDKGIDLKIVGNDDEQIIVQIKNRKKRISAEGVSAVRELNGVLFREGVPRGIVVTTARRFTKDAFAETRLNWALPPGAPFDRYRVELFARSDVIDLLNLQTQRHPEPWRPHLVTRDLLEEEAELKQRTDYICRMPLPFSPDQPERKPFLRIASWSR
jgi:hypothetical protein